MAGRINIKVNDIGKLEELAQEMYNDLNSQMNLINTKMNELVNSTNLAGDVSIYDKVALSKAVNDFIKSKDSAIRGKLDLAKMMRETNNKTGDLVKEENLNSSKGMSFDKMNEYIKNNANKKGNNKPYEV